MFGKELEKEYIYYPTVDEDDPWCLFKRLKSKPIQITQNASDLGNAEPINQKSESKSIVF
jgi:hypothetical protein